MASDTNACILAATQRQADQGKAFSKKKGSLQVCPDWRLAEIMGRQVDEEPGIPWLGVCIWRSVLGNKSEAQTKIREAVSFFYQVLDIWG